MPARRLSWPYKWVAPAAVCALLAGCAGTPKMEGPNPYLIEFQKIDSAHTGKITLDQAIAYYGALFDRLDTNHDGFLTAAEAAPALPLMQATSAQELIAMLDKHSDGKLTKQEFLVVANWLFQKAQTSPTELTLADVSTASEQAIKR